jgi:hypothetical protein
MTHAKALRANFEHHRKIDGIDRAVLRDNDGKVRRTHGPGVQSSGRSQSRD